MAGKKKSKVTVEIEVDTEVLRLNEDIYYKASYDRDLGLILYLDVRKRDWMKLLELPKGSRVRFSRVHTVNIKELSSFLKPITYRLTIGEGYWIDPQGTRHNFGLNGYLPGIDLKRGVSIVTLRAAVMLAVLACVGVRSVSFLMRELFHVEVDKSSLDRWLTEAVNHLPDAEGMVRRLLADKPVTEAHLDEIFPKGRRKKICVVVIKDEHGRILATKEMAERSTDNVVAFLKELKSWGLNFERFYIDGCLAYKEAIPLVYDKAAIQYDYFHIIQNIFRHLWKAMVQHRREVKAEAKKWPGTELKGYLETLGKRLWKHRYLVFKREDRMNDDECTTLCELMGDDLEVPVLRRFIDKVWGIFRESKGEEDARKRLAEIKQRSEVIEGSAYSKAVNFLEDRFDDMIAFLHVDGLKRNSLAESGMRCLRRLERGHDGFRTTEGRENYIRLYQAIRYCGWSVHRGDGLLNIPPLKAA